MAAAQPVKVLHLERLKKPEKKESDPTRVSINQAYAWNRARMGGWSVAQSPIMSITITPQRLLKRGYESTLLQEKPEIKRWNKKPDRFVPPYAILN